MTRYANLVLAALITACGGAAPDAETTPAPTAIALPNQVEVDGYLTGGQPTEADLRAAAAAGYRTIINLRTSGEPGYEEERALVLELGMAFEAIPIVGAEGVTPENAAALDALLASASGPTMVHCGSGNRVGALFALRAFAAGHTIEESMEIGRGAGLTRLEGAVQERLNALCAADADRAC